MQVNAAPAISNAIQYAPPYGWQTIVSPNPMIIPTSNCPPIVEYQAKSVDAQDSTGHICEVAQNVAIVEKQSPAGTVFIPIQRHLSQLCAKFHCRTGNYNEYTLGDIYLAVKSETGYVGGKQCISPLLVRLQAQLLDTTFACSEQGQFTQLLLFLREPIKIRRQGAQLIPLEGPGQLEEARFEHLFPYDHTGRSHPKYYWMYVSLPAFGGDVLHTIGTPEQLLRLFKSG